MIELDAWYNENKISMILNKTHYEMMKGNILRSAVIKLRGESLRRSPTTAYLRITLNEKRTFLRHVQRAWPLENIK